MLALIQENVGQNEVLGQKALHQCPKVTMEEAGAEISSVRLTVGCRRHVRLVLIPVDMENQKVGRRSHRIASSAADLHKPDK
jgi:hypothetical protein